MVEFCSSQRPDKGITQQAASQRQSRHSHLLSRSDQSDADTPTRAYLQALEEATAASQPSLHVVMLQTDANLVSHNGSGSPSATQFNSDKQTHPFAELQWQHVRSEVSIKADSLDFFKVWLQSVSLQQVSVASAPHDSNTLTSQPQLTRQRQDVLRLAAAHGVEHTALMAGGQPLACHLQLTSQADAATQYQLSVHCGAITLCHIPGFLTDCVTFATHHQIQHDAQDASKDVPTPSPTTGPPEHSNPMQTQTDAAAKEQAHSIGLSVSVLSLGAGALSASTVNSHAAWINSSRLSCHLGSIRARGRPGSLVAGLFALQQGPQPLHGLRVSAAGIQLGLVQHWRGGIDASTLKPVGLQAISNSFEVQVLLQGWPLLQAPAKSQHPQPPTVAPAVGGVAWPSAPTWQASSSSGAQVTANAAHDSKAHIENSGVASGAVASHSQNAEQLLTVAISSTDLKLSGLHIAMLAAVAGGAVADSNRGFRQSLPQQGIAPESMCDQDRQGWLASLSLHTAAAYAMYAPTDTLPTMLAQPPWTLQKLFSQRAEFALADNTDSASGGMSTAPTVPKWVVLCDKLSVGLAVGSLCHQMPALSVTLAMPHAWGSPGLTVGLPACEVSIAQATMQTNSLPSDAAAAAAAAAAGTELDLGAQLGAASHRVLPAATDQPPDFAWTPIGSPVAVLSNASVGVTSPSSSSQDGVTITVSSLSLDADPLQLSTAVQLVSRTVDGPVLPVLPSYPPFGKPSDSSVQLQLQVHAIFGQLSGDVSVPSISAGRPACDLAFWLVNTDLQFSKSTQQVHFIQHLC